MSATLAMDYINDALLNPPRKCAYLIERCNGDVQNVEPVPGHYYTWLDAGEEVKVVYIGQDNFREVFVGCPEDAFSDDFDIAPGSELRIDNTITDYAHAQRDAQANKMEQAA